MNDLRAEFARSLGREELPVFLTAQELGWILSLTPDTVKRQAGHALPSEVRIGSSWRFRTSEVLEVLSK